jgi:hypothetical protein
MEIAVYILPKRWYLMSLLQLSNSLNWEEEKEIATLIGSVKRRRESFTVHIENIQLLGDNVCNRQQQQ